MTANSIHSAVTKAAPHLIWEIQPENPQVDGVLLEASYGDRYVLLSVPLDTPKRLVTLRAQSIEGMLMKPRDEN